MSVWVGTPISWRQRILSLYDTEQFETIRREYGGIFLYVLDDDIENVHREILDEGVGYNKLVQLLELARIRGDQQIVGLLSAEKSHRDQMMASHTPVRAR